MGRPSLVRGTVRGVSLVWVTARPWLWLKGGCRGVDDLRVDAAEKKDILDRYLGHARRFEEAAARRKVAGPAQAGGEVIPLNGGQRPLEVAPTARELEVLQHIADGLANREIGTKLFLSEETVKSHVRHLLAKLTARSRAHAVAVGLRRGLID